MIVLPMEVVIIMLINIRRGMVMGLGIVLAPLLILMAVRIVVVVIRVLVVRILLCLKFRRIRLILIWVLINIAMSLIFRIVALNQLTSLSRQDLRRKNSINPNNLQKKN